MTQEICLLLLKFTGIYFLAINMLYGVLMLLSWVEIKKYRRELNRPVDKDQIPAVSFIIPAFNEESLIVETIQTYLALPQDKKEIIVINDGSHDQTFRLLHVMFQLKRLDSNIFQSITTPALRVLEAAHLGKAQALNFGIAHAKYDLICTMDADTIPSARGVEGCLRAFAQDPKLIAAGGVLQIMNSRNMITTFQSLEYLRTFLCERLGWSLMGATSLISGAFCMVKKDAWKKVNGFRANSITEDLDFIVRLRRAYPGDNHAFKILPFTTCHTQVPKDTKHLMVQRMRWQMGLVDTLARNLELCFNPKHGIFGLVALPYSWIVGVFSPVLEFTGLLIIPVALIQGWIDPLHVLAYLGAGLIFNLFITLFGIYLDNNHVSKNKSWSYFKSSYYTIVLHFGYKQLTSWWRLIAVFKSFRRKYEWGEKPRQEITPQTL